LGAAKISADRDWPKLAGTDGPELVTCRRSIAVALLCCWAAEATEDLVTGRSFRGGSGGAWSRITVYANDLLNVAAAAMLSGGKTYIIGNGEPSPWRGVLASIQASSAVGRRDHSAGPPAGGHPFDQCYQAASVLMPQTFKQLAWRAGSKPTVARRRPISSRNLRRS
jgi:hypothetical protein